jgi:hypothetical protein
MAKLTNRIVREIAEKRERSSGSDASMSWRTSALLQAFNSPLRYPEELLKYYAVAIVAMIEGYFRSRLAVLITSGEPFLSNALSAYSEIKLDMSLAGAIVTERINIGELITHSNSMSINNFADLVQIVRNVTGHKDFLEQIARIPPAHLGAAKDDKIIADPDATWAQLGKVFTTRHILCHEIDPKVELEHESTRELLLAAQNFLKASSIWLHKLQNPNPPMTLEDRAKTARTSRDVARKRLDEIFDELHASTAHLPTSPSIQEAAGSARSAINQIFQSIKTIGDGIEEDHHSMDLPDYDGPALEARLLNQVSTGIERKLWTARALAEQTKEKE